MTLDALAQQQLAEIKQRHARGERHPGVGDQGYWCTCGQRDWPCDAAVLIAIIERS